MWMPLIVKRAGFGRTRMRCDVDIVRSDRTQSQEVEETYRVFTELVAELALGKYSVFAQDIAHTWDEQDEAAR